MINYWLDPTLLSCRNIITLLILSPCLHIYAIALRTIAARLIGIPTAFASFQSLFPKQANFFSYHAATDYILVVSFMVGWLTISNFFPVYFLFFSALWITIFTDSWRMLISRFVSLYAIPVAFALGYAGLLHISLQESILSATGAYLFLYIINKIFYCIRKHNGLGQGDVELFAFIGSMIGFLGCWFTMLFASTVGTLLGALYLKKSKNQMLPFGPFLALGAILYLLCKQQILQLFIIVQ